MSRILSFLFGWMLKPTETKDPLRAARYGAATQRQPISHNHVNLGLCNELDPPFSDVDSERLLERMASQAISSQPLASHIRAITLDDEDMADTQREPDTERDGATTERSADLQQHNLPQAA